MNGNAFAGRRFTLTFAGLIALASMLVVLATSGARESHAAGDHSHALSTRLHTEKQLAFHDAMRALWETHGAWTHMVIAADPRFLSRGAARQMMQIHLRQVIEQAVDELHGNYAADARAFAPYIRHILDMADMISNGIIRQFPSRFR